MAVYESLFYGHLKIGSAFVIWALWLTVHIFNRYYRSVTRKEAFTSRITYTLSCLCVKINNWPAEAIGKLTVLPAIIIYLIYRANFKYDHVDLLEDIHSTMLCFFLFTGVMELFIHFQFRVPHGVDYGILALAFTVMGMLTIFHLKGRHELDVFIHVCLSICPLSTILAVVVEMSFRHNVLAALVRPFCLLVTGTWFCQISFILYPLGDSLPWKSDSRESLLFGPLLFTWHIGAHVLVFMMIAAIMSCYHKGGYKNEDTYLPLENIKNVEPHDPVVIYCS